jgi:hypothetical protein
MKTVSALCGDNVFETFEYRTDVMKFEGSPVLCSRYNEWLHTGQAGAGNYSLHSGTQLHNEHVCRD